MPRQFLGIDLGGSNISAALVSSTGRVIYLKKTATLAEEGWKKVVRRIIDLGKGVLADSGTPAKSLQAIGVGAPGIIDGQRGLVITSPNLPDWKHVPLAQSLRTAFRKRVFLDNDANMAAYGEKWLGAGAQHQDLIVYTVGTGVGGGIITQGEIHHGHCHAAGEVGHVTILPDGPLCSCGNRGCLEALASATAIARQGREILMAGGNSSMRDLCQGDLKKLTSKMVFDAAHAGDEAARGIIRSAARYLGIAIAGIINLLNPELVVVGGGVSLAGEEFLSLVRAEVQKRALKESLACAKIVSAKLGDQAGVIGAAGVAMLSLRKLGLKRGRRG